MGQPVVHFEVTGKDGKKLQEFYASLFDWKIDADNPIGYGSVEAGEGGIGGGVATGQRAVVTFYVAVPSLEEALRKAESLGGNTVMQPMEVPGGGPTIAVFQDPEGNTIGLVKQ